MGAQVGRCRCAGVGNAADLDDCEADYPPALAWAAEEAREAVPATSSTSAAPPQAVVATALVDTLPTISTAKASEISELARAADSDALPSGPAQKSLAAPPAAESEATAPAGPEAPKKKKRKKPQGSEEAQKKEKEKASATNEGADSCPGMKAVANIEKKKLEKLTPLQKIKKRKEEEAKKALEMRGLVDDILAGKFEKKGGGGGQPKGDMLITMPSPYERENTKLMFLEGFRVEYRKMSKHEADAGQATEEKVNQYSEKEVAGLTIQGGHRPIPRPQGVKLPKDFRKPVGMMPLKELRKHDEKAHRKLISVYGDIFDVSDRPDKYGADGPYHWMTGQDVTWGFVSGKDVPEEINKFYDMWKIAPKDFQQKKLQGLLAWVAFYEFEYGGAIGRLQEYKQEAGLKGPPMEESEECCVM